MLYLDTSLLVSAFTSEDSTERVQQWLSEQTDQFVISDWSISEFSAALSIKVRTGPLTVEMRDLALSAFRSAIESSLALLPVERHHFRAAARISDSYKNGLRAADSLHLAISMDSDARLCTLDKRLAEAGATIGAGVLLI